MIEIERLVVTFDPGGPLETRALKGVDLTLPKGAFVTVIGGNGAGKSTLLNALAGEVRPGRGVAVDGAIRIAGADVTRWSPDRRASLVSRVFQNPAAGVCEALSIEENFALAAARGRRRGLAPALRAGMRARFQDAIAALGLGLEDRLGDRIGQLSGGQRQALCLVMATTAPAEILLLDEHTAALDPRAAGFVIEQTRRIVGETGATTLMVTHSMTEALACGARTIMMDQGRIVRDLTGAERDAATPIDLAALFQARADAAAAQPSSKAI